MRQIDELYHVARMAPPAEREALLAHADTQVRAEVESLLAQDSGSLTALDVTKS